MDDEVERAIENLTDFIYTIRPWSTWDYFNTIFILVVTLIGIAADIIIIYMIAKHKGMQSKTNLMLMHIAITDALFLMLNVHFVFALLRYFDENQEFYDDFCLVAYVDVGLQMNVFLFMFILLSNTLMKSKVFTHRRIAIGMYTLVLANFISNGVVCVYHDVPLVYYASTGMFIVVIGALLFKEVNNCYKKWYKKDPLESQTRFRLNIVRIYIYSWVSMVLMYLISNIFGAVVFHILVRHCLMSSLYILIYIIYADKNFKICAINLSRCKSSEVYDVDATITFAEEAIEDNANVDYNQVQINFNDDSRHQ